MATSHAPSASAAAAPTVVPAEHDALRPGDVVTLRRWFPAGYWGANTAARVVVKRLTIRTIARCSAWAGEPNWYLEGVEPDLRGCWAIGKIPCGMVTVLTLHRAAAAPRPDGQTACSAEESR